MKKTLGGFNPIVKNFLEENPDTTIIGLFWAGFWRWYLSILIFCFIFGVLMAIFE